MSLPVPVPGPDPVSEEEWLAWCEAVAGQEEPADPDEVEDPGSAAGWECDLNAIVADCRRMNAEEAAACARAVRAGWLGGQPVELLRRGHAIGHGCGRPEPKSDARRRDKPGRYGPPGRPGPPCEAGKPGFSFTATGQDGPPGRYGTWRLSTRDGGRVDLLVALDPISTRDCGHRYQAQGHDPGVKLRHLTQIRYAMCAGPGCRRPSAQADLEHNVPIRRAAGPACAMTVHRANDNDTHQVSACLWYGSRFIRRPQFRALTWLNAAHGRTGSGGPAQFVLDCPADPCR